MNEPDGRFTGRLRGGDLAAWQQAVQEHYARVYGLALRMLGNDADAADVTQETYCRAFECRDALCNGRPFRPWLLKIATNLSIDALRRRQVRSRPSPARTRLPEDALDASSRVAQAEETQLVRDAVGLVPPPYRAVLLLRFQQGLSCEQIAQALDISRGAVWARLCRAKAMVRKILERDEA